MMIQSHLNQYVDQEVSEMADKIAYKVECYLNSYCNKAFKVECQIERWNDAMWNVQPKKTFFSREKPLIIQINLHYEPRHIQFDNSYFFTVKYYDYPATINADRDKVKEFITGLYQSTKIPGGSKTKYWDLYVE